MTAIVGLIADDKSIYIGSDDWAANDVSFLSIKTPKVILKEKIIFGISGSIAVINAIKYKYIHPKIDGDMSVGEYVYSHVAKHIQEILVDNNATEGIDGCKRMISSSVIIFGLCGEIFVLDEEFQLYQPAENFVCVGSGQLACIGAMFVSKDNNTHPEKKITNAVQAAAKCMVDVGHQVTIQKLEYSSPHGC